MTIYNRWAWWVNISSVWMMFIIDLTKWIIDNPTIAAAAGKKVQLQWETG